jgi:hypothetical protein
MPSWYEQKNGETPSAVSRHEIPISEIKQTLKWQRTKLKQGDILMVRTGYVRWHNQANETERKSGTRNNNVAIGVQASNATIRWLYDQHLTALVGDNLGFEAWPPKFTDGWCLHEWILVSTHLLFVVIHRLISSGALGNANRGNVGSREVEREVHEHEALQ